MIPLMKRQDVSYVGGLYGSSYASPLTTLLSTHHSDGRAELPEFDSGAVKYRIALVVVVFVLTLVLILQRVCSTCGSMMDDPSAEDPLVINAVWGHVVDGEQPNISSGMSAPPPNAARQPNHLFTVPLARHCGLYTIVAQWMQSLCVLANNGAVSEPLRTIIALCRRCVNTFYSLFLLGFAMSTFLRFPYSVVSKAARSRLRSRQSFKVLASSSPLYARIDAILRTPLTSLVHEDVVDGLPLAFMPRADDVATRRPLLYSDAGEWIPVVLRPFATTQRELSGREATVEYSYHHDAFMQR